ncbi:MAG: ankyrin repeat domain-containing protein [Desulfobacterales bacterium]|jgi:hypothetical protein
MRKISLMLAAMMILAVNCNNTASVAAFEVIKADSSTRTVKYNAYGQPSTVISKDGLTLLEFEYNGSYFKKAIVIFAFENTGKSRDYTFNVKLTEKKAGSGGSKHKLKSLSKETKLRVEADKKYNLRVPVLFGNSMSTQHGSSTTRASLREFTIQWIHKTKVLDEFSLKVPAWDAKIGELRLTEFSQASAKVSSKKAPKKGESAAGKKRPVGGGDLLTALYKGQTDRVLSLLDEGVDPNAKMPNGETALMVAADRGSLDSVRALLTKGANVNAKRDDSKTALMAAAYNGHAAVIRALLDAGAEVNAKNKWGRTALGLSFNGGHPEVAPILEKAGGKR